MDIAAGGFPLAGRRRVAQLSQDEWREALQQQMREKEQLKKAHQDAKRAALRAPPPPQDTQSLSSNQTDELDAGHASSCAPPPSPEENPSCGINPRAGGRRFVRAMSNDEWRASLEEQIRQKERQQQPRHHTAPTDMSTNESVDCAAETSFSSAATILPQAGDGIGLAIGGRRRGVQTQQTREEYLRGLQEQIELKTQQQEAEQTSIKTRGRHGRRRIIEDDDDTDGFWPCRPKSSVEATSKTSQPAEPLPSAASATSIEEPKTAEIIETQNPFEAGTELSAPTTASPSTEVAMDPAALSKLFVLCEGMKQQNEELKQQLREQQTVLVTLSKKKAVVDETPSSKTKDSSKTSKSKSNRNDRKPAALKPPTGTTKATEPKRAPVKTLTVKPSGATSVGMKLEKTRAPRDKTIVKSVESVDGAKTEVENMEGVAAKVSLLPAVMKSRLPPPRVIPRLRTVASATVTNSEAIAASVALETHKLVAEPSRPKNAVPGLMEVKPMVPPVEVDSNEAVEITDLSCKIPRLNVSSDQRLPRLLVPSPPTKPAKNPPRSHALSVSLPRIVTPVRTSRSPLELVSALGTCEDCLDEISSVELTATTRMRELLSPYRHHAGHDDLEAFSSSTAVLYGPSTMIPCESTFYI